jgi:hypothetical protein
MVTEGFPRGEIKMHEAETEEFDWQQGPEALLEHVNGGVKALYEGLQQIVQKPTRIIAFCD